VIFTIDTTQNAKTQKTQMSVFVQNCKKPKMEIFAFCVITFEVMTQNANISIFGLNQSDFRPVKHIKMTI
jgi:hypothetical protein